MNSANRMTRLLYLVVLWACFAPAMGQAIDLAKTKARVTFSADNEDWVEGVGPLLGLTIRIRGEINGDTLILVRQYYDLLSELMLRHSAQRNWKIADPADLSGINVHLESLGGEVDAAIEVGRFLRSKQANVIVPEQESCASACLLLLAGGATRTVSGKVGIHRPFLEVTSRPVTPEGVKRIISVRNEQLRAYFREMNISERLADDMMTIPSTQIKWLSSQEIAGYGIGADDPVILEAKILNRARKYGLTRIQYEERWLLVQKMCGLGSEEYCEEKIMKGLPR
jgi:ATP-dependent protease ClpP protease subunit